MTVGKKRDMQARRTERTILINEDDYRIRTAILKNNLLTELVVERKEKKGIAGNIYKGKVKNIIPGIDAAFVDIGWERTGFLYISEVSAPPVLYDEISPGLLTQEKSFKSPIEKALKEGEDIIVQVVRDPVGNKGPRLTTFITIAGRFLVLMPFIERLGISKKIVNPKERNRIAQILNKIRPKDMGLILRTLGEGKTERELIYDLNYVSWLWKKINFMSKVKSAPSLLYQEPDLATRFARDILRPEKDKLIVDNLRKFVQLKRFFRRYSHNLLSFLEFYNSEIDLYKKYGVEEEIQKALRSKVWLPSGGSLAIEGTEALVSIDVNSGKFTAACGLEDTALKTNLEAAKEIARQVILRNLGGIIIIDFIDMRSARNRRKLTNMLRDAFKDDRAVTKINTVSSFGLIEMTRERINPSLAQILCESCPCCQGSGFVKSIATVAIEKEKEIKKALKETKEKILKVRLNPEICRYLKEHKRDRILERIFRKRIVLEESPILNREDIKYTS
ncbi:MAG: Rne/Rng family ribonuclease [Candidatus Ratteibacteria bacterium]|nr:Rne/Rng family ribonuclease [Candidatus Ratteibacteria bacterium]